MKAKRKQSQTALIRALLTKKVATETIVERAEGCGGNPTVGYVNYLAER